MQLSELLAKTETMSPEAWRKAIDFHALRTSFDSLLSPGTKFRNTAPATAIAKVTRVINFATLEMYNRTEPPPPDWINQENPEASHFPIETLALDAQTDYNAAFQQNSEKCFSYTRRFMGLATDAEIHTFWKKELAWLNTEVGDLPLSDKVISPGA